MVHFFNHHLQENNFFLGNLRDTILDYELNFNFASLCYIESLTDNAISHGLFLGSMPMKKPRKIELQGEKTAGSHWI